MLTVLSSILGIVLLALSAGCAWHATTTARTPQGAVGWVVFLLAAPYVAVIAYAFLGRHKYRGYAITRRDSQKFIKDARNFSDRLMPTPARGGVSFEPFEKIARLPALRGNSMELLIDGQSAFDAIFKAIDDAQRYILAQYYIIRDDETGRAFRDRLVAAAERGVSVRLLFDPVGCNRLPDSYFPPLRQAGVSVMDRRSARGASSRFQINFRNHRKTVIVDGSTGFTGGLNVGDEYMGRSSTFGAWRDTNVMLRGPVVTQLQLIFAEDWHWITGGSLLQELEWNPPLAKEDMTGLVLATGPGDEWDTGALYFFSAITAARHRIWIASPYFVPDIDVLTALKHAALRGVDVRVLVPAEIDHWITWLAAHAFFDEVTDVGVNIWCYREGFMHQKVILIDDDLAGIGTTNMDNRSFRLNFETMALFFDRRAAASTEAMLTADFERAVRLQKRLPEQPASIRFGAPLARLFAPLL